MKSRLVEVSDTELSEKVSSYNFDPVNKRFVFVYEELEAGASIIKFDFLFFSVDKDNLAIK
jgi:hypothetical protein